LLYDAGPRYSLESDAGHRVLVPLLRALGERVDTLVLSHRDSDHTGGAAAVLAQQPGATVLSSIDPGDAALAGRTGLRCQAGQRWRWDGVEFELLHPRADDYAAPGQPNALSCVLRVQAAQGASALLAGDIEAAQEAELARRAPAALRADVLLVPHHGSRSSSSPALLEAVQPRWALVQAGWRNRFGHPAPQVLGRYQAHGVRVADSPACGAMHWSSALPDALQCERTMSRRYWHHVPPSGAPAGTTAATGASAG
jgi:competence protein ComEC